jgi:hypothetical protein
VACPPDRYTLALRSLHHMHLGYLNSFNCLQVVVASLVTGCAPTAATTTLRSAMPASGAPRPSLRVGGHHWMTGSITPPFTLLLLYTSPARTLVSMMALESVVF